MKPSGDLSRSKPLQRTTPLVRHTPLVRGKGLQRSPWPRHQPPIPQRKPARTRPSRAGQSKATRLVRERPPGGRCEVRILGICLGKGANFHHRVDRVHGGPWSAPNGLRACGSGTTGCHGALTNPPPGRAQEFERNGWILPASAVTNFAEIPALMPRQLIYPDDQDCPDDARVRVLLTDDGRYLPAGEGN